MNCSAAFYSGFDTDAEFVTIINPEAGDYQVVLQGMDNGLYKLGIDILDDDSMAEPDENFISGIISTGDEEGCIIICGEDGSEIEVAKDIELQDLITDLSELHDRGEIEKESVNKVLAIKFALLDDKYEKMRETNNAHVKSKFKKQIIFSLEIIKKELNFYLNKEWILPLAFEILISDIDGIIRNLTLE